MSENWRTQVDAGDYFGGQKKKLEVSDRRPVIRRASDLVGPNIGASATRITDFNDLLATYDGYCSAAPGAANAPNGTDAFVGFVVMDSLLGGKQVFTSLATETEFSRVFLRGSSDPDTIAWGDWVSVAAVELLPSLATTGSYVATSLSGFTVLGTPSTFDTSGVTTGVFSRTGTQFNILKAGVYSGALHIGSDNSDVNMVIEYPQSAAQTSQTFFSPDLTSVMMIPLHFFTTVTTGFIRVTMTPNSGSGLGRYYRLALTRLGDA